MRWATTRPYDLVAVAAIAILTPLAVAALPDGSLLRVSLGLFFLLFAPGYALVAALFPERARRYTAQKGEEGDVEEEVSEGLEPLERVALSLGLSIAVVPLLGLALNFSPWGIRLVPILVSVAGFTLLASGIALWRRVRLPAGERLELRIETQEGAWSQSTPLDKTLTVLLVVSVLAAAGALAYVLATPRPAERFTEFYILGPSGKAEGYPSTMTPGGNATLIVGVVAHEGRAVRYDYDIVWVPGSFVGNETNRTFSPAGAEVRSQNIELSLEDGATDERSIELIAPTTAGSWRVEFRLHLDDDTNVYRRLHLFVDVA